MVALEVVTVYLNSLSDPHTVDVLHCGDTALAYVRQSITGRDQRSHHVLDFCVMDARSGIVSGYRGNSNLLGFRRPGGKVVNEFYY